MSETLVARRYAEALGGVIVDDAALQPTIEVLDEFAKLIRENAELRAALQNPSLDVSARMRLLDALTARMKMSEAAASFLRALLKRHRIGLVESAVAEFSRLCDIRLNRESAEIVTAVPLSESDAARVVRAVEIFADKSIHATLTVDPDIIGGIVVKVGGFVLDRSVRNELNRIRRRILEQE